MLEQIIHTERLLLRPPELADADTVFQSYAQDPEVTRYLTWRPHRSLADTQKVIRAIIDEWSGGTRFTWAITRADDGAVLGMLAARVEGHMAVIGYVLARSAWGNGYMPEAVRGVIEALWALPAIFRIWAVCDVENVASARVLEKAGMLREGRLARFIVLPNLGAEPRDVYCYAIVR
jgi:ribosomal-protein-alanine N-acetyltransferase